MTHVPFRSPLHRFHRAESGMALIIVMLAMLAAPRGLWGLASARFDLRFFPVQRRVRLLDRGGQ